MTLEAAPGLDVVYNEPLARYTAARLGGPADVVATARTAEGLLAAIHWARRHDMPWRIIGGGANVLVSDAGFCGLIILNRCNQSTINAQTGIVEAESGATLIHLARRCMSQGLKGLAWGVSVPGTLGGAVVNNAGAHGADMASNLHSAAIIDFTVSDEPTTWPLSALAYDYRYSKLKGSGQRYLVVSAVLQLEPGHNSDDLNQQADEFIAYRKRTQPPGASLGSMFKNPPGDYAGRLIDAAGLKGHRVGGVQVSPVHANFFINHGTATAADYRTLIEHVQTVVHNQSGVTLELEIEWLGTDT